MLVPGDADDANDAEPGDVDDARGKLWSIRGWVAWIWGDVVSKNCVRVFHILSHNTVSADVSVELLRFVGSRLTFRQSCLDLCDCVT